MPSAAPIGVFDSGIGGLTVVRELVSQLPNEDVIYFGDTARVPYGPKSPDTVRRYSQEIASFLRNEGVKALVVACNTATAHALESLRHGFDLPVIGVIEPGSRAASRATRARHVGVIGTQGTIASGAYERAIHSVDDDIRVTARACPLFVPFAEEGWVDHRALELVAGEYLAPLTKVGIDALVLGCTHYPLLSRVISSTVGPDIALIDSAAETAAETARVLRDRNLEHPPRSDAASLRFIASDAPQQFLQLGQRFLGSAIHNVETITLG